MGDRIKGFYVSLEEDVKDEDFEYIKNAVLMIKGVLSIKENIRNADDYFNRSKIKNELWEKIYKIFMED